jgi:hypothetical protein
MRQLKPQGFRMGDGVQGQVDDKAGTQERGGLGHRLHRQWICPS